MFASQNRGTREKKIWHDNEISSTDWKRQLILTEITGPYGMRAKVNSYAAVVYQCLEEASIPV